MNGAREVADNVLKKITDKRIKVFVVWTPSYTTDNNSDFVKKGIAIMNDKRVTQYWDGDSKIAGSGGYGDMIKLPRDAPIAYDVYFYFDKDSVWGEKPPMPKDYLHQVFDDGKWFDPPVFNEWIKNELARIR